MNHWQFIHSKISQKKPIYLLTVVQHKGSSPGRQGFKMVVAADEIFGSIGGGIMEFNLVEHCRAMLGQQQYTMFVKRQIHKGSIREGSGMICSGEQTILFVPLLSTNLDLISDILHAIENDSSGLLTFTKNSIRFSSQENIATTYTYTHNNDDDWCYKEMVNRKDVIYIVGSGHVGLATTKLFSELGFYTVVVDNRTHLNTFEANLYADKKIVVPYETIAQHIPNDETNYVVIMTNKYTDDKLVLSQLLKRDHKFIGVLGSTAKLKVMFEVLKKEGFSQNQLDSIHAPIGLNIKSQTPLEIAISIASQIIEIKNQ